uniref:Protein FAR1-RELATED SEQUENCE n=2 Tax=Kalanchoe fedtschenkoi TaxID=63787 RepID=A0A7N1A7R7_KALFE
MDQVSLNSEPVNEDEAADGYEVEEDGDLGINGGETSLLIQGENPIAPAVGMEFETYEDVYYFYNCYAKDQGFGVRVSNTWYRKSREKYRGKLSCSSAGYKRRSEANRPRPETRTGCPAMIKFRLMESCRWRIIEAELEHNHLISPVSGKFYKSHKQVGSSRTVLEDGAGEAPKARTFRTVVVDAGGDGNPQLQDVDKRVWVHDFNQLNLKEGDARAVHDFFRRSQLNDPQFFYAMDHNEKGTLRNVFWADGRCRGAFKYFHDVVAIDTTCLTRKYAVPLVVFVGTNHHGQLIIFGCGLLAGETADSYTWLFRTWLTMMLGHPPQTIITNQSKVLQAAISEVFPKASHLISLVHLMESYPCRFRGLFDSDAVRLDFNRAVYDSVKTEEFETAWERLTKRFGLLESDWFKTFYEDRKRCVPVYVKDTFLAGLFPIQPTDSAPPMLLSYVHEKTSLTEFFVKYDEVAQTMNHMETMADVESRNGSCVLRSRCHFELQVSKLYTSTVFKRFQDEVEAMYSCTSTIQMNDDGPTETHIVREHVPHDVNRSEAREFEVSYNPSEGDVKCICRLFNLKGYLCRHALCVLSQCGLVEIPAQYLLSRWRKDIKRTYVVDHGHDSGTIDTRNPVNRHDHLCKVIVQIAEEGCKSRERYKLALQLLGEMMSRAKVVEDDGL